MEVVQLYLRGQDGEQHLVEVSTSCIMGFVNDDCAVLSLQALEAFGRAGYLPDNAEVVWKDSFSKRVL